MNEWTPGGATALLLVLRHSCWCFGTPIGASSLLLMLRHSYWCFGTPVGASALLLVLWHSCCMGSHVLIGASALLLVLRHSCYVYRHVLIGTTVPQFCIVPSGTYCAASYSFLTIGSGSQTVI